MILNIETSSEVCSVALCNHGELVSLKESANDKTHAAELSVFVNKIFEENSLKASSLSGVAVSKGPGSYTGLRIGVSMAKGMCYAAGLPLIAVSTCRALTAGLLTSNPAGFDAGYDDPLFCPMIDARRDEVYLSIYNTRMEIISPVHSEVITHLSFLDILQDKQVIFFGPGAGKCKAMINHCNAIFIDGIYPSARYMAAISYNAYTMGQFEDVAYFEPFYLKDFIATVPRKKVI